jgi:hypothetical protein
MVRVFKVGEGEPCSAHVDRENVVDFGCYGGELSFSQGAQLEKAGSREACAGSWWRIQRGLPGRTSGSLHFTCLVYPPRAAGAGDLPPGGVGGPVGVSS